MSVVLSEHLPLLTAAPDGIQKLRGLILELAVWGKLVLQDPNDEPSSELLKQIAKERARLEAEGVCKKSKTMPLVGEEEQPFGLPDDWKWVRLGVISDKLTDGSHNPPPNVRSGLPMLSSQNVQDGWIDTKNASRFLSDQDFVLEDSRTKVTVGDVLLTIVASIGRSAVVKQSHGRFALQRSVAVIQSKLFPEFLSIQLRAPVAHRYYDQHGKGTAQKGIYLGKLGEMPVAVPPLAEQHRIVAKVDELMALCDRLEAEQMDAEAAHTRLVETLLDTLTQSTDATELATNWQRLAEHFDTLFTTESSLDALKQTILQLAVMGKLVPQDPDDEPASELLKRIAKERTRLQAKGVSKTLKPLPSIGKDNQPSGWDSASLPELCEIGGGATPSKAKSAYWGEGIPWVSPKDMKVDHILDTQDHVTELALSETRLPRIKPRSLLVVVRGMILLHSFPVATTQIEVAINQDMKSLTPFFPELLPYLALVFRGWKAQILELVDRSTHGTCKLQSEKLFAFRFGIPPLAEQHRIVAKVDELTALCDRLKADLIESRNRQARLSATLIESALQTA